MHTFRGHKSEDWIKPGSKLWFHFLGLLETKKITEGILDISFYHSINQKILSRGIKKFEISNFAMFLGIKCDVIQAVNDISTKPSVKIFMI